MNNATPRTVRSNRKSVCSSYYTKGTLDTKQREIGMLWSIEELTFENAPATATSVYSVPAGVWYDAHGQAARNREPYGACQSGKLFRTLEEAQAYIEQRKKSVK